MIATKEKTIGKAAYACTQFTGRHGLKMQARLLRLLGPVLGGLLGSGKSGSVMDLDVDFGAALGTLAQVDPDEFTALAVDLLASTRRDGKEIGAEVIDLEYAGNYGELYQALAFVVDHNFGNLFGAGGIGDLAARLEKLVAAPGPSPAPSMRN